MKVETPVKQISFEALACVFHPDSDLDHRLPWRILRQLADFTHRADFDAGEHRRMKAQLGLRELLVCVIFPAVFFWLGNGAVAEDNALAQGAISVSTQDISAPKDSNWLSYNGDYSGRRYSPLSQINVENAHQLRAQWVFHAHNSDHLEVTPIVVNGTMFVTSANDTFALDAQTGRSVWHNTRPNSGGLIDDASRHISRGVGLWHNRVYRMTDNAHLLCLDARSGNLIWDVAYADWNSNYGATGAPLVVKDKIIVGTSGGDDGVRGFVAAYDAESGKLAWRFWTIPAPGERGSDSWPGDLVFARRRHHLDAGNLRSRVEYVVLGHQQPRSGF